MTELLKWRTDYWLPAFNEGSGSRREMGEAVNGGGAGSTYQSSDVVCSFVRCCHRETQ